MCPDMASGDTAGGFVFFLCIASFLWCFVLDNWILVRFPTANKERDAHFAVVKGSRDNSVYKPSLLF